MPDLRPRNGQAPVDVEGTVNLVGSRPLIDIVIPRTNVKARLRLCSRKEEFQAKADARRTMIEGGYPVDANAHVALGASEQWLAEMMVQMIAVAVREPGTDPDPRPLASVDDWRDQCDDQQLLAIWSKYEDHEHLHDPIGAETLTATELEQLIAAAKKKDPILLMAYGSRRLALFAITTASQPASSETPRFSSGPTPS